MDTWLRWFLLVFFVLYVGLTFTLRSYLVWRRTGINPLALGTSDSTHDYVGKVFGLTLATLFIVVLIYDLRPDVYALLLPIPYLDSDAVRWVGVGLLAISFVWTMAAQSGLGTSWRIGIDAKNASALMTDGIYRLSRNPIFLGMRVTLLGLFLVIPDAITLAALVLGEVVTQIQVRLEEEFLARTHGDAYQAYRGRTQRWL